MSGHTHRCANCQTPVECEAELVLNPDGWPNVICEAYHLDGGGTAELLCEACLREDDLRHDANQE